MFFLIAKQTQKYAKRLIKKVVSHILVVMETWMHLGIGPYKTHPHCPKVTSISTKNQ